MGSLLNKAKLLGELVSANEELHILKDRDGYRVIINDNILNEEFKSYNILTDTICILKDTYDNWHLYDRGELVQKLNSSENSNIFIMAHYIKELINKSMTNFKIEDYDNEFDWRIIKHKAGKHFIMVTIKLEVRTFDIVYDANGKELVSFEDGYKCSKAFMGDKIGLNRMTKNKIKQQEEYGIGQSKRNIDKEAISKFGENADRFVLINTEGNVVYASDQPISICNQDTFVGKRDIIYKVEGNEVRQHMRREDFGFTHARAIDRRLMYYYSRDKEKGTLVDLDEDSIIDKCKLAVYEVSSVWRLLFVIKADKTVVYSSFRAKCIKAITELPGNVSEWQENFNVQLNEENNIVSVNKSEIHFIDNARKYRVDDDYTDE